MSDVPKAGWRTTLRCSPLTRYGRALRRRIKGARSDDFVEVGPPEGYTRIHGSGGFGFPHDVDLGPDFLRHLRDSDGKAKRGEFKGDPQKDTYGRD